MKEMTGEKQESLFSKLRADLVGLVQCKQCQLTSRVAVKCSQYHQGPLWTLSSTSAPVVSSVCRTSLSPCPPSTHVAVHWDCHIYHNCLLLLSTTTMSGWFFKQLLVCLEPSVPQDLMSPIGIWGVLVHMRQRYSSALSQPLGCACFLHPAAIWWIVSEAPLYNLQLGSSLFGSGAYILLL